MQRDSSSVTKCNCDVDFFFEYLILNEVLIIRLIDMVSHATWANMAALTCDSKLNFYCRYILTSFHLLSNLDILFNIRLKSNNIFAITIDKNEDLFEKLYWLLFK